jgi:hypothetical protein
MNATASSCWPTPTVDGNHNRHGLTPKAGDGLATAVLRWPTPTVNMAPQVNSNARQWDGFNSTEALAVAIERGLWPTPSAGNFNEGESLESWEARRERELAKGRNGNGFETPLAVAVQRWPTPQARDGDGRAADASRVGDPNRHGGYNLDDWVKLWNAPRAAGGSLTGGSNSRKTAIRDGSYVSGSLNPAWVEMLQGFPEGWTATAGRPRRARSNTRGSRPAPSSAATPSPTEASG